MIYPKNSFYTNFVGAYKSNDVEIRKDLLFSQIGQLIAKDKKKVISVFKEVGVTIPKNASDKDVVDAIIKNSDNRRMHIGIAYLIYEQNKKEFENHSNVGGLLGGLLGGSDVADDDNTVTSGKTTTTATDSSGNVVSAIAGAVGSIFGYAKTAKEAQAQKESDRSALMQAAFAYKTAKASQGSNSKSNTVWWIVGGIVVVGAIGLTIYFLSKKGVKADGGVIEEVGSNVNVNAAPKVS